MAVTSSTTPSSFPPGYPIDRRPPARVARRQESYFGDFEALVGRVVARMTGERVVIQDDGTQDAMVDMYIEYEDGHLGCVEVWTDTDEADAAMRSNLYRSQRRLPAVWPAAELGRVWFVTLSGESDLRTLAVDLLPVLGAMEAAGELLPLVPTRADFVAVENSNVGDLLRLGVVEVHWRLTEKNESGAVKLYPKGVTGLGRASWGPFLRWVADTLASPRLETHRAKLARPVAAERHLVLGATASTPGDVYFALTRHPGVPAVPPELEGGITHLWVMDPWGERCITWFAGRGWLDASANWATA